MTIVPRDRPGTVVLRPIPSRRPDVVRRLVTLPGASRMSRPELEPTPLTDHGGRKPIEIVDRPITSRWDTVRVVLLLAGFLVRLLGRRITGGDYAAAAGRDLRAIFERLGGLWMKVGQLMSLRRDVLPIPFCDELAHLQSRAVGFPGEQAIARVEEELGTPIDRVFSVFDPVPIAAASLSQVHAARLIDCDFDVAVKVLRPGVERKLVRDMWILRKIAGTLSFFSSAIRKLNLRDALIELEEMFKEEIDYRYEASNIKQLRKTMKGQKIYVPQVFEKHSTRRVLVMEWVSGPLMSDFIRIRDKDPARVEAWLEANGIDPEKVGRRLLISFMRQLFEDNLFHADLHPGNIVLLKNSQVALIDLGTLGTLDREFLTIYRGIQRSLAEQNFSRAADLQLRLCAGLPEHHLRQLRTDLSRCLRIWSNKSEIRSLPFHERSVNTGSAEVSSILGHYGVQQSWEFLKIGRTLATLDASLEYLYPGLDYVKTLESYFEKASERAFKRAMKVDNIKKYIGSTVSNAEEYSLILGPVVRGAAFSFQGTVSKVSRVSALIVRLSLVSLVVSTIVLIYEFIKQHHGGPIESTVMDDLAAFLPDMSYPAWILLFSATALVLLVLRRILRELLRPESPSRPPSRL